MEIEENARSSGASILSESPVLDSAGDINISTSEATMSIEEIATSSRDSVLSKFDVLDSTGHKNGSGLLNGIKHDETITISHNPDSSVIQDFGTSNKVKLAYDTRQEPSYFDAFECLYDVPEVYSRPTVSPYSYGFKGRGYMATSYSDSDPDEVDDTDSSLSVEKCLAYFNTPELLTRKSDQSTDNGDLALHNGKSGQRTDNGDLALNNGKSDDSQDIECCSDNRSADKFENENGQERESGSGEDEEVDSKSVKVVKDASKKILSKVQY